MTKAELEKLKEVVLSRSGNITHHMSNDDIVRRVCYNEALLDVCDILDQIISGDRVLEE